MSTPYATLSIAPEQQDDGATYFDCFPDDDSVKEAVMILSRAWKTAQCMRSAFPANARPCMFYHLGACLAPCSGQVDSAVYNAVVAELLRFLSGGPAPILRRIRQDMKRHSALEEYEQAAACKNLLSDLEHLRRKCRMLHRYPKDRDVMVFIRPYRQTAYSIFFVRDSIVIARQDFTGEPTDASSLLEQIEQPQPIEDASFARAVAEIYADKQIALLPVGKDSQYIRRQIQIHYRRFMQ